MDDQADYHSKTTLTTGDFAYVPAGIVHAFKIENTTTVFGAGTAGFERFFHAIGQKTDATEPQGVYVPDFSRDARRGREVLDAVHARVPVPRLTVPSILEIDFAQPAGFRPLSLDLRTPEMPRAPPSSCSCTAAGGCAAAARSSRPGISDAQSFDRIVAAGFAVASCEYRLSGEARFPAQLDDVDAAIDVAARRTAPTTGWMPRASCCGECRPARRWPR